MPILNIGILAHVDAGKTSTVEQLLFRAGAIRQAGSVDKGNTQTDWLPLERQRGISIRAASTTLYHRDRQLNIIDTPGHMDFVGEVERALAALDAVVLVVSALEGIQSQTEVLWRALRELNLPCLIFVNKIDRAGCQPDLLLEQLRQSFIEPIIPLHRVSEAGSPLCQVTKAPIDEEALLALCSCDQELEALFLEESTIEWQVFFQALKRQTAASRAFPLLYGSATLGIGIDELLDAIVELLPAAPDASDEEPSGLIYRIEHDAQLGKLAHLRLFSGSLKPRDTVRLQHRDGERYEEKITQIRRPFGSRQMDMNHVLAGDIAAVCGLSGARTGDILGELRERRDYQLATPVYAVRVSTEGAKQQELLQAIAQLADEDPLLAYEWVAEKRELHLRIMGEIQLEVLDYLLKERYRLPVSFSPPSVIYKETPLHSAIGFEAYTMPKPCWAIVKLRIDPLPRGSGLEYRSEVGLNRLDARYQSHIETSVPEALQQGRLGWEVTDLRVSLIDGESHIFHTHPLDFFLATPIAVQDGLEKCGAQLLEPLVLLRMTADEGLVSRMIGDVLAMRGSFDSPVSHHGRVSIEAIVPVAESSDYAIRFASLTSGKGILQSRFHGYQECPPGLGERAERRGVDPLDRSKWILHRRGALS